VCGAVLAFAVLALGLPRPAAAAGEALRGLPLMQRYTAEDIPATPSHLAVAADDAGVIYAGNAEGVLRFGGDQWELFELPGGSAARALHRGADGRIYVGGYDQFGVLETEASGELRYTDLRPRFGLEGAEAQVGDVWAVLETPRGLFFRADRTMYFLGQDGATRQWPLHEDVRSFNVVGEALYARVKDVGFTRFEDGRLVPLPDASVFAQRSLIAVLPRGDGLLLAADDGFFESDADGIRHLPSDADAAFAEHPPYSSQVLADGSLVFGSYDGMLQRFSPELRLLDQVRLGANTLLAFAIDREGGLWTATEVELVRLRLPSPWTTYDARHGLVGLISDIEWYDDTLWAATSVDVLRAHAAPRAGVHFVSQEWTELEAFDLEPTPAGLLVAERDGLLVLDSGASAPRRLATATTVYVVQRSELSPDHAWALAEHEMLWLGLHEGRWRLLSRWPLHGMNVNAVFETAVGELWAGDLRGEPQRWRLDVGSGRMLERRRFGAESGLVLDPQRGSTLFRLDQRLHVVSGDRIFALQTERFVAADPATLPPVDRPMELTVLESAHGSHAWTSRQLLHRDAPGATWRPVHVDSPLAHGFRSVQADADGRLRVITWGGILQFDPDVAEAPSPPLLAGLERVSTRIGTQHARALPRAASSAVLLPPRSGIAFRFGLVSMEPGTQFRYRVHGYSEAWSDWSEDRDLAYRVLPPGEYLLELEARTRSGRAAEALRYPFHIAPEWYQTPWAWAAAVLGAMLLTAAVAQAFVRLRYRQFIARNRRLERRISERTAELEDANRRLSELATEDSLTGVANRRALEQALGREWQRCGELRLPLAVVMVDVDHFKQFNDRHGHLEGDQQLRRVAQVLKTEVHPVRELLARFGGEEFALVLPGLHLDEAMARAERLRQRFTGADSALTISLGVAALVPRTDLEPAELLRRADTALYRAKRKGRNRVEAAEE
jgi:diguanylate cyclase (GGDEF)-like protein